MSASADISVGAGRSEASPAAPNWPLVPFPVGCARCGQDLRGLTEPKCPLCGLEFEWSEAVPIEELTCEHCGYHLYGLSETRCPECGEPFTWEGALELYHRRRKPLFEYWWRQRPVRSLMWSWWLAMRPWKLWRTVDIHDPPPVRGLVLLLVVAGLFFVASLPVLMGPGAWSIQALETWADPSKLAGPLILNFSRRSFWGWRPYYGLWEEGLEWYPVWLLDVAAWTIANFLALQVYQQSMSLCKVRTGHVFRAFVYAVLPVAVTPALYCIVTFGADVWQVWTDTQTDSLVLRDLIPLAFGAVICFWMTMSLALAYRRYIRMKHAWGVALSTQVIALLVLMCVSALVVVYL